MERSPGQRVSERHSQIQKPEERLLYEPKIRSHVIYLLRQKNYVVLYVLADETAWLLHVKQKIKLIVMCCFLMKLIFNQVD